jgi:hypothetical protein
MTTVPHGPTPLAPTRNGVRRPRRVPPWPVVRGFGLAVLIPLFLSVGMALAYLGAFHAPAPHELPVGVVGTDARTAVAAQTITDESDGALVAHVVPSAAAARAAVRDRTLAAVLAPDARRATLYLSTAASPTTATVTTDVFAGIAYRQGLLFHVVDVVPTNPGDGSGQGLFFLLVALSIGGYAGAVVLAGVAAKVGPLWTAAAVLATSAAMSALAAVIAGPVYGVLGDHAVLVWLLSWWYVAIIQTLGVALHPLLKHWTTPVLTALFVMLNFTSSGGVFQPELQPGFFAGLHTFWLGAAWLHASGTLQYFFGQGIGGDAVAMGGWTAGAVLLAVLTRRWVARRTRVAVDVPVTELDEVAAA